jgi:hypothetical protein
VNSGAVTAMSPRKSARCSALGRGRFKWFMYCLNALFAIKLYVALGFDLLDIRVPGHSVIVAYVPTLLYGAIALLGLGELIESWQRSGILRRPVVRLVIMAYGVVFTIMFVRIPWNADALGFIAVIRSCVLWLLPAIAVFGLKERNWHVMRRVACWQSAIAVVILSLVVWRIAPDILANNPLAGRLQLAEAGGGIADDASELAYASVFLLVSFRSLSTFWRFVALAVGGLAASIALIGQFRSGVLIIGLAAAAGFVYVPLRARVAGAAKGLFDWTRGPRKVLVTMAFVICTVGALVGAASLVADMTPFYRVASEYVNATQRRAEFAFSDSDGQSGLNLRIDESRQALSELSSVQLVFGKGIGATWSGGTIYHERREMVHLGVGQLTFFGGIALALLGLSAIGMALYVFLRSRLETAVICASVVCLALVQSFAANIFDANLNYLMILLCLGGTLLHLLQRSGAPS